MMADLSIAGYVLAVWVMVGLLTPVWFVLRGLVQLGQRWGRSHVDY